jgi:hypothetical protein
MRKNILIVIVCLCGLFSFVNTSDASSPAISFTDPTPANGTVTSNTSVLFNVSITNTADLSAFAWNWNGTNYTLYNDSLVLMMNLDNVSALGENATKAVDMSRNGKNGTIIGGANYTSSGKYGGAYTFDGLNDYINCSGRATNVQNNWAISAWIKPGLSQGPTLAVYNGNDGAGYGFGVGDGAGGSGSVLTGLFGNVAWLNSGYTFASATTWYHVVMMRSGGTTYFYVNGAQTSGTSASTPNAPNDRLTIGSELDSSNNPYRYFKGTVDEVRIYNRALSVAEIQELYYSDLYKYDTDKWVFITNQSSLTSQGSYTYQGCAKDIAGNLNCTETRTLLMGDWAPPGISFTDPTPANGTVTTNTSVVVNISLTNASDLSQFIWNWNGTNYTFYNGNSVLMFNLDNVSALGENATKAVDVSSKGNNGTFYNSPVWTSAGEYNKALNFAGTTYVSTGITGFSASAGTVLMWIKPNKNLRTVTQALFDTRPSAVGALRIYSTSDTYLHFETGGSSALTWTIPSDWTGQWHQVGLKWSGSSTYLIIDGSVVASGSNTYAPAITTFEIGRFNGGSNFNGTIDEVRVYNYALSAAEITQQDYSNLYKYDTDKWAFTTNQSNLTVGIYTYQGFANDTSGNANQTDLRYLTVGAVLSAKDLTPVSPVTTDNLLVNATCSDIPTISNLTAYVWMYNGSTAYGSVQSATVSNGANTNFYNLSSSVTTKGENWTAEVWCGDGILNTTKQNTSTRTIGNTAPTLNNTDLTPVSPLTTDNLLVNITCSDIDIPYDTITAYAQMYNDSTTYGSVQSAVVSNGTNTNFYNLSGSVTSAGENWTAEVWCGDGTANTTKQNTSTRTINAPPPTVTTLKTSYKNCTGIVYYKATTTDENGSNIDANLTIRIFDPSDVLMDESDVTTGNGGTGIYLGSYQLDVNATIGEWLIRAASCGAFANKPFNVE